MSLFQEWFYEDPGFNPTDAIEYAIDEYHQGFQDYWGLESHEPPEHMSVEAWSQIVDLHRLAEKLTYGAMTLTRPRRVPDQKLALPSMLRNEAKDARKVLDDALDKLKDMLSEEDWRQIYHTISKPRPSDPEGKWAFLLNSLELQAYRSQEPLRAVALRMLKLSEHLIRDAGAFTRAYLSRVSTCYLNGMNPEFAVMARGALDNAIADVLDDEQVRRLVGPREGGHVDLERKIEACCAIGWWDGEVRAAATRVREEGNRAAHQWLPQLDIDPDEVLKDLALVLRSLENRPSQ